MAEFVALVAIAVLVLGLGVLAVASLVVALAWLMVLGARRGRPVPPGSLRAGAAHHPRRRR
jgi:hypothetical protein